MGLKLEFWGWPFLFRCFFYNPSRSHAILFNIIFSVVQSTTSNWPLLSPTTYFYQWLCLSILIMCHWDSKLLSTVEDLDVHKNEFIWAGPRPGLWGWEKVLAVTDLGFISRGFLYNWWRKETQDTHALTLPNPWAPSHYPHSFSHFQEST